jgi:hypothetical protein
MSTRTRLSLQAALVVLMGLGSLLLPKRAYADSGCSSAFWCWPDCNSAETGCESGNSACHAVGCGDGVCSKWSNATIYCSTSSES